MPSSPIDIGTPLAESVVVRADELVVDLADGRTLTVPLSWYPRLAHATPEERADWRLIGLGEGIHWPQLDEDISVEGLVAGRRSAESQTSLRKWLASRPASPPHPDSSRKE
jgi:hypothetical protein